MSLWNKSQQKTRKLKRRRRKKRRKRKWQNFPNQRIKRLKKMRIHGGRLHLQGCTTIDYLNKTQIWPILSIQCSICSMKNSLYWKVFQQFFCSQLTWNPLIVIEAQQRAIDKALSKPQPWQVHFREFRAYVDTVLDYLRRRGYNAKVCMRIASERDWCVDVRQEKMWIDDLNQKHHYKHYLYRKESIFYGTYQVTISVLDSI